MEADDLTEEEWEAVGAAEDAPSCQKHFIPCQGNGKHNDGRAIWYYQKADCYDCAKLLAQALLKWKASLTNKTQTL